MLTFRGSEDELKVRLRAFEYLFCLQDILNELRSKKHVAPETTWDEVNDMISDILTDREVFPFDECA